VQPAARGARLTRCSWAARTKPLLERKKLLKALLPRDPLLRYSEHIAEFGTREFAKAQRAHEEKVKDEKATTWLIPKLVGEVKFTEWTSEDEMRHPAYLGLRTDKKALDVIREQT
jgi:ATP-dependent DNA ligase